MSEWPVHPSYMYCMRCLRGILAKIPIPERESKTKQNKQKTNNTETHTHKYNARARRRPASTSITLQLEKHPAHALFKQCRALYAPLPNIASFHVTNTNASGIREGGQETHKAAGLGCRPCCRGKGGIRAPHLTARDVGGGCDRADRRVKGDRAAAAHAPARPPAVVEIVEGLAAELAPQSSCASSPSRTDVIIVVHYIYIK